MPTCDRVSLAGSSEDKCWGPEADGSPALAHAPSPLFVPTTLVCSGECWGSLSKNAPRPPRRETEDSGNKHLESPKGSVDRNSKQGSPCLRRRRKERGGGGGGETSRGSRGVDSFFSSQNK